MGTLTIIGICALGIGLVLVGLRMRAVARQRARDRTAFRNRLRQPTGNGMKAMSAMEVADTLFVGNLAWPHERNG